MAIILPSAFINSLAIGTTSLGILFVVKDLFGASPALVGSLGALWSAAYFIGCLALRGLSRRLAPRKAMASMLASSAAILTILVVRPSLVAAFACYAAYGFVTALYWPPLMGWLSKGVEGAELNRATSLFSFSWSVGGIFSPYIAGVLSERNKLYPIILSIILFSLNAIFIVVTRNRAREGRSGAQEAGEVQSSEPVVDRSTPLRFPAWLGAFLIYAVMGVVLNVFPVFARDELFLAESAIGLVLMTRAIATAAGFYLLSRLTFWQYKRAALPVLSAGSAIALAALAIQAGGGGFAIGFAVIGLLQSAMYNNSLFYGASGALDKDRRATIHEAVLTLGTVIGSITGGIIYEAFSMSAVFVGLAILLGAGALVQAGMSSKPRRLAVRAARRGAS